jgi:hypothetical protein
MVTKVQAYLVKYNIITLCDKVCQWHAACQQFSLVSPTNKNWPPRYTCTWNIVESGVKHYNPNPI